MSGVLKNFQERSRKRKQLLAQTVKMFGFCVFCFFFLLFRISF